jgi:hypothetical protein
MLSIRKPIKVKKNGESLGFRALKMLRSHISHLGSENQLTTIIECKGFSSQSIFYCCSGGEKGPIHAYVPESSIA